MQQAADLTSRITSIALAGVGVGGVLGEEDTHLWNVPDGCDLHAGYVVNICGRQVLIGGRRIDG